MELVRQVDQALSRLGVEPGAPIGVAVSGGADSVALAHLLSHRQPHLLHVDHGRRDGSADDARFVAVLAGTLGLRCDVVAVRPTSGTEADLRAARYAALGAMAQDHGLRHVATAHTRDDQAETVLLRLIRGAGTRGLAGIPPVRGRFVRPLLDVGRDELRRYLLEHGLAWREDPTNADVRYERNWVRHELLTAIAQRRPGAVRAIARTADLSRSDDAALDALALDVLERAEEADPGILLRDAELRVVPTAIASRVVLHALRRLGSDADRAAVARVLDLEDGEVDASGGVRAVRLSDGVLLVRPTAAPEAVRVRPERATVAFGVSVRLEPDDGASSWRATVPTGPLWLRSRRPGDRVRTRGGTRKVQDVLVDGKVPRALRDLVPVLATEDEALAVVGMTIPPVACPPDATTVHARPIAGGWWPARWWSGR